MYDYRISGVILNAIDPRLCDVIHVNDYRTSGSFSIIDSRLCDVIHVNDVIGMFSTVCG